mmetsp:Transcript_37837/g.51831  ORF Transcript_37837/g.51831 Transcript_37837/m.51831 type:complete len:199 (+) Transcript_37837:89-685(+)
MSAAAEVPAIKAVLPSGAAIEADLAEVNSVADLRSRLALALDQDVHHLRLLAQDKEVSDSDTGTSLEVLFPKGVATVILSEVTVYYLEDCQHFNWDSDVDGGEDEIELDASGAARRQVMHRRSWLNGNGDPGSDVRTGIGEGTWSRADDGKVQVEWTKCCPHKGKQPSLFDVTDEGLVYNCSYRKRLYKKVAKKQMKP